ncbi:hypothetical protein EF912_11480 [Streptomyces sp. WAC07061]|uniref:hypothetical protein n=1 Tax=Streptomyces sp. WAC07061 TaxID=2487410 RepID=UPI000F79DB53|nr:hypothetical protein [Streptomyces sp. WAC07061]RSS58173.1 hypothetical protein EF912_11480 [Streptomyces sp. WAC07061]
MGLTGLLLLNGFALAAFAFGRLAVRLVRRAPGWAYAAAPPLAVVATGWALGWLMWPSYAAAPGVLLWWLGGLTGAVTWWTCQARTHRRRH